MVRDDASSCPRCGLPILRARMLDGAGTVIDVDPTPHRIGIIAIRSDPDVGLVARIASRALPLKRDERLYVPHHAVCESFRRPRQEQHA